MKKKQKTTSLLWKGENSFQVCVNSIHDKVFKDVKTEFVFSKQSSLRNNPVL